MRTLLHNLPFLSATNTRQVVETRSPDDLRPQCGAITGWMTRIDVGRELHRAHGLAGCLDGKGPCLAVKDSELWSFRIVGLRTGRLYDFVSDRRVWSADDPDSSDRRVWSADDPDSVCTPTSAFQSFLPKTRAAFLMTR